MSNLLTSMGWPCGHEAIFGPHGIARARDILSGREQPENSKISGRGPIESIVGDSSYMSAPFLRELDVTVIHVVRNPLKVVASLIGGMFRNFSAESPTELEDQPDHILYERFMYEHLPELGEEMPQLDRGCLFYMRWNEMIESSGSVDLFHRIEDPIDRVAKLMGGHGCGYNDVRCNSFSESSKIWSVSEIKSPKIRSGIVDIMKRYGYSEQL